MRRQFRFPASLAALLLAGSAAATEEINLPDFGDSAGAIFSRDDERIYGRELMRQLRNYQVVIEDPQLVEYLDTLAYRLEAANRPNYSFQFVMLDSPVVNAFAAPGGVVALHSGLLLEAERESEVAAVLAHEIAHVTQHHLARALENSIKDQIPILLATLGAAIAGSGNGDATQAAIVSGMALLQQRQINFTRSNEKEADRVGIQTLAKGDFEVDGMASFFGRLNRITRTNSGGLKAPEFLRTHPVSLARVSEAKARADQVRAPEVRESVLFDYMRERIRVRSGEMPGELIGYYDDILKLRPLSAAERYGQALAVLRLGQGERALALLESDSADGVEGLPVALARIEAYVEAGQPDQARSLMAGLLTALPENRVVVASHAQLAVKLNDADMAEDAQGRLRSLLLRFEYDPGLRELHARTAELSGDQIRAAESYAEATFLRGRARDAMNQLERLEQRSDLSYYQRARIQAQIARMAPIALNEEREYGNYHPEDDA